jgi:hypothetical protein
MKTLILALRDAIHGRRIDEIKNQMSIAEDVLNNIVKKEEGSEVFNYYLRELIEMINLTNHMKGCPILIAENTEDQWISFFLLLPRPDQIIQPDISVKDAPDVDKALQKSADQDFTTDGNKKRLNKKGRLMIDHHTSVMAMSIHIESDPDMLRTIANALERAKSENRGRPKKGFLSQPRTSEIRIFND